MTKQTSVDYFHDEINKLLPKKIITTNDIGLIWVKAKEMEKEQKMNDFIAGMEFIAVDPNRYKEDAEQYYNETYGGNDGKN